MFRQLFISIIIMITVSCGESDTGKSNPVDLTKISGYWELTYSDLENSCENDYSSGTTSDNYLIIKLSSQNDVSVRELYNCSAEEGKEAYENCSGEKSFCFAQVQNNSIVAYDQHENQSMDGLDPDSDTFDCVWNYGYTGIINFIGSTRAETIRTANYKAEGSQCDSELFNEYLENEAAGSNYPLNYKDCSYYLKNTYKKIAELKESDKDDFYCNQGEYRCFSDDSFICEDSLWKKIEVCGDKQCDETTGKCFEGD